jgi:hypothetical protein
MKQSLVHSRTFKVVCYPVLTLGLCLMAGVARSDIVDSQRTVLHNDIVHYTFDVDLGPDEFDTIRLHRVVREQHPGQPIAALDAIFLLPGAPNYFEQIFIEPIVSDVPPWDQSIAVFLAKNDIDVWGMDYAWAMVPLETTEFGFMQDWGLQRDIDYAEQALATVRSIRVATGRGKPRLHVLGFSYGVPVAFGIAGDETQLPPGQRMVKGIISVDYDVKVLDEARRQFACESAAYGESLIAGGTYHNEDGVFLMFVGNLAKFAPGDPSPIFPGFTNWQAALLVGTIDSPWWHFWGGEFDEYGIPTGLRFTDPDLMVDLFRIVPPYFPVRAGADLSTVVCDEADVPFDDHLGDITVPILAVGAAGGAGPQPYTPWLTASRDIEQFTVQFLPDDARALDFGHADLFTATNAEEAAWQPILEWLLDHQMERTYP